MEKPPFVIAHVLHRLYLAGAEVLASDLSRKLRRSDPDHYRFIFLCLDEIGPLGHQLIDEEFTVIDLQRQPGIDWSVAKKIRRAVREHEIDLLHAHQYTPFFYSSLSRGLGSHPRVLFTEHGRHYPDVRSPKRVVANKFLIKRHDRVTAVGHFVKQALINNEGIAENRIDVIHNGIDPKAFLLEPHDADEARTSIRKEIGIRPDQVIILQVARFHPVKDHPTSIRAFAEVCKRNPEVVLWLVGDGDERVACEELTRELDVQDRVHFLGVRKDIPRLMTAADIFVLSSLSEGISVTLLEAMGSGLPIAATDVGGNPEVVVHEETGLLSPRGDPAALGKNLMALVNDPRLRSKMGLTARERLLRSFSQDQMHESYTRLYDQMTETR